MASKDTQKVAPEYTRTRKFISDYAVLGDDELDIVTIWTMHTWLFSPSCDTPPTTPYLYITAPKGSGKTLLGQDILGTIARAPMNTVGITGPGLIRLVGGADDADDEQGSTVHASPTLTIDEVDALYSGAKDEVLRMMLNAGYRRGGVVPRVVGKEVVNYSAFCPKILMGIDNGHLPDTVTDRSIRIDLQMATPEQMETIQPFYHFEVEDEAAELSSALAEWARRNSADIKQYKPVPIDGLRPRQWEIARTLVQVARAAGVETIIRTALHRILTANPAPENATVRLYESILAYFTEAGTDRLTTNQILDRLAHDGVGVPGGNGKGLGTIIGKDGIKASIVRFPRGTPGVTIKEGETTGQARGFYRYQFDGAFHKYLGQ